MSTNTELPVKLKELQGKLIANLPAIRSVLPKGTDEKRFCRMCMNAVIKNPALANCNPDSFAMAVINAGELGLEIGLGQAALIPYNGIVQCQVMYQGIIELARRSGEILTINADVVRDGDTFDYGLGMDPFITHRPVAEEGAALTYVYAVAKLTNGEKQFEVMTRKDVMKIKASSKGATKPGSPWINWEAEMFKKSAIKRLCKLLPKSVQLQRALSLDDAFDSGRAQTPAIAEIDPATIDISSAVGTPQGDGEIKQPKAKEPVKEKPPKEKKGKSPKLEKGSVEATPEPKKEDAGEEGKVNHQELAQECMALEGTLNAGAISKAKDMVGVDEAAELIFCSTEELTSLLSLYKEASK